MREDCDDQCADIASERLRYFTGRYMTARDFRDEQMHHLTHRYLHNRILHGWGVVCGLHVYPHPVDTCRNDHVRVDCGMALDCCGREIVVRKTVVPPPIPWEDKKPTDSGLEPVTSPTPGAAPDAGGTGRPAEQDQEGGRPVAPLPAEIRGSTEAESAINDQRQYPLLCLEGLGNRDRVCAGAVPRAQLRRAAKGIQPRFRDLPVCLALGPLF